MWELFTTIWPEMWKSKPTFLLQQIGQRRFPATSGHKPRSIRSALSLSSCSPSFITQIEAWRKKA
ncbi:hypothetical protein RchiOBHm_Chr1g0333021 [Rosa chinensis]|uniref:Uncharacterized protein n=1 Tax=Rosa chinensis TaxID=74649 RepID=A0A2P6SBY8_ROSCH|nr:hypothetical protein RchiOBHm_Chr1g0333021 [Rosa chinensis]